MVRAAYWGLKILRRRLQWVKSLYTSADREQSRGGHVPCSMGQSFLDLDIHKCTFICPSWACAALYSGRLRRLRRGCDRIEWLSSTAVYINGSYSWVWEICTHNCGHDKTWDKLRGSIWVKNREDEREVRAKIRMRSLKGITRRVDESVDRTEIWV